MATEADLLARKKDVSDRISGQVRTLSVSLIGVNWLFLVPGKDGPPPFPSPPDRDLMLVAGASALLALGADFLQYVANYQMVQDGLATGKATGVWGFDSAYWGWKASNVLFWVKQGLLAVSFFFLAWALLGARFGSAPPAGSPTVTAAAATASSASGTIAASTPPSR